MPGCLRSLHEFAEPGFEDALHAARPSSRALDRALIELVQIGAAPEASLELVGLAARALSTKTLRKM